MGSLNAKNASEKFSCLGTFKEERFIKRSPRAAPPSNLPYRRRIYQSGHQSSSTFKPPLQKVVVYIQVEVNWRPGTTDPLAFV
jgi:hypothetical protein